jgi:hypothetical protein
MMRCSLDWPDGCRAGSTCGICASNRSAADNGPALLTPYTCTGVAGSRWGLCLGGSRINGADSNLRSSNTSENTSPLTENQPPAGVHGLERVPWTGLLARSISRPRAGSGWRWDRMGEGPHSAKSTADGGLVSTATCSCSPQRLLWRLLYFSYPQYCSLDALASPLISSLPSGTLAPSSSAFNALQHSVSNKQTLTYEMFVLGGGRRGDDG